MIKEFMSAASAIALSVAAPAFAQDATGASGDASAAGGQDTGIADIVVTAQRRAENVQDSSLSIEVISGDALSGVTKPQDITAISPGVVIANQGPQTQVYIRGVGDATGNSLGQAAVAFNIDGVYYARPTAISPQMFDIERIEVLKGPQGTLYGRNASGGAVNILTNRPRLGAFGGYAAGEVGNYDMLRGEAGVNLPLGRTLALRIAGQVTRRDGYLSNGTNDQRSESLRARLLFEPADGFSMMLNGDVSHVGGLGGGIAVKPSPDGDPWRANTTAPYITPFLFNPGTAPLTTPNDYYLSNKNKGVSLEVNADLGFATLTFIPAYRAQDLTAVYYAANFRYAEHVDSDQLSGELRLSNDTDVLKWVAGLYYFNEDQDQIYTPTTGTLSAGFLRQSRDAVAAFGQASLSVTPALRLIGGARYTSETVNGRYNSGTGAINVLPYVQTSAGRIIDPIKKDNFSYKVGVEVDLAARSMAYATYATGFKAGGFNPTLVCATDVFGSEELRAFTAGVRNRFLDNKLQVNVEGFYWEYKDQQATFIARNACGEIFQTKRNIGDATIKGGNIDIVFRATSADTLRGSVEFTDARFDTFSLTQLGPAPYIGFGSPCTVAPVGAAGLFNANCAGQRLTRTPKWSGNFGYSHEFTIGDGSLTANLDGQYASSRWLDFGYVKNGLAPGYVQLNAQLTYKAPNDRWSLSAYIENITNEAIYTGGSSVTFPSTVVAPNGSPYYVASIQPPRMFGARLRMNFGE